MNRRHLLHTMCAAALSSMSSRLMAQTTEFRIAEQTTQLILGLADGWNDSTVILQRFERQKGTEWRSVGNRFQGRLGAAGLVWGWGLHPVPAGASRKQEGDRRAPAGVFGLGVACGYAPTVAKQPAQKYFQITERDLWVEDPASPRYNQHIRLQHPPQTPWEVKQQMKQGDPAHSLKLFILHNAPKPLANAGSSIFFHIWRAGGTKPSSGCTTMAEASLREMIRWVDPTRLPVYVLLPRAEYERVRSAWGLPDFAISGGR